MRRLTITLLLLASVALPASAQEPAGGRRGRKEGAPPATPRAPLEKFTENGEVRIRADSQGGEKGHYQFRGFVDLQMGEMRIQADRVDFYQEDQPDGTTKKRLHAEGNVVFLRGEERLSGETMDMDLDASTGAFTDAIGYVSPGVFVEARRIDRLAPDRYQVTDGKFTSCAQPNPRWAFSASSAGIHVDHRVTAKNVVFKVKSVPALYIPYFAYPIQHDERSTGILFPHFGYSSTRGFNLGDGFFWAMGRSTDQTFYVDNYSKYGWGLGHELRWMRDEPSRGTLRTYFFRPKLAPEGSWDHDIDWNAMQVLPHGARAALFVRDYSNQAFQENIQESLDYITNRNRRSSLTVDKHWGATTAQAVADSTDTFFGDTHRINRHLPTLRVTRTPQKNLPTGLVWSYATSGERLAAGEEGNVFPYGRVDLWPKVSRPVSWSFLQLTPEVQGRYTRYSQTLDLDEGGLGGPSLDRKYGEVSMEMRGPNFSRVFNTPGFAYAERLKHVIGPEVTWRYRSRIDDFDVIPKFDGNDYVLGTDQLDYALVQHFYAKRPTRDGRTEPWEFLNWRIGQSYYVQISDNQSEFDPNYSSAYFGPGGEPSHYSPLQSRVQIRPTASLTAQWLYEYDVNFRAMRSLGLSTELTTKPATFSAGWSRAKRSTNQNGNILTRDTLRGGTRLDVVPGRLSMEGTLDWDLLQKQLIQTTVRAHYSAQCCGLLVEFLKSSYNVRQDTQFRFAIELANIGSIGNFMGSAPGDARRRRNGGQFGGY